MIHVGDCIEVMAGMPADSVDAVVTDPPYGLEFMGKEWDRLIADAPNAAAWRGRRGTKRMEKGTEETGPTNPWGKESTGYRGGERHGSKRCRHCGKRQFSGTPCKCPEPDWETVYPEGPPSGAVAMQRWHELWGREALRVTKPGGYLLAFGGTRTHHRLVCGLEDAGWIIRDELDWIYASGFPKGKANLKPAHEPIVLARKPGPLRPLAIDAGRIPTDATLGRTNHTTSRYIDSANGSREPHPRTITVDNSGGARWPSNVLLSDPALFDEPNPEVVGSGAVTSSGSGDKGNSAGVRGVFGRSADEGFSHDYDGDVGGYSRFFKIPQRSNDDALRTQADESTSTDPAANPEARTPVDRGDYPKAFLIPKSARADREPVLRGQLPVVDRPNGNKWTDQDYRTEWPDGSDRSGSVHRQRSNLHPTVKPTDLMRHLIRLVTPTGGTVLDCFAGSGSTLIAAELEGFPWVGIEQDASYVAIAEARLNGTQRGLGLDVPAPTNSYRPPAAMPKARWGKDEKAGPDSWFHGPEEAA